MSWSTYESRIDAIGPTRRNAALKREWEYLANKLPNSLSYHKVTVDGAEQDVAIINTDNLNEKFIYSMPAQDLPHGGLVYYMDCYWLITERDFSNEAYTRCRLLQCNYLLKWVDTQGEIYEQWCAIEDGTKLKRGYKLRNSLAYWKRYVKTTPLIAGNSLEPYNRNGAANSRKRHGLKTVGIGQSAAKPRTEEGSTTIRTGEVHPSGWKRGALNRKCGMVKI